jgi:hypothetical protein
MGPERVRANFFLKKPVLDPTQPIGLVKTRPDPGNLCKPDPIPGKPGKIKKNSKKYRKFFFGQEYRRLYIFNNYF